MSLAPITSIRNGMNNLKEMGAKRMSICKSCPMHQERTTVMNYSLCTACGCVLEAKVLIAAARCPKDKWPQ